MKSTFSLQFDGNRQWNNGTRHVIFYIKANNKNISNSIRNSMYIMTSGHCPKPLKLWDSKFYIKRLCTGEHFSYDGRWISSGNTMIKSFSIFFLHFSFITDLQRCPTFMPLFARFCRTCSSRTACVLLSCINGLFYSMFNVFSWSESLSL